MHELDASEADSKALPDSMFGSCSVGGGSGDADGGGGGVGNGDGGGLAVPRYPVVGG